MVRKLEKVMDKNPTKITKKPQEEIDQTVNKLGEILGIETLQEKNKKVFCAALLESKQIERISDKYQIDPKDKAKGDFKVGPVVI